MLPDDIHEVALGDYGVLVIQAPSCLGFLLFSPLLLVEVGRVEELWRKLGACGSHPVHHLQEQALVVVVQKCDSCPPVAQPSCSANLGWEVQR